MWAKTSSIPAMLSILTPKMGLIEGSPWKEESVLGGDVQPAQWVGSCLPVDTRSRTPVPFFQPLVHLDTQYTW